MVSSIIWKDNLVAFTAHGFNFDEFKAGELREQHTVLNF
jgi:hypothetical protein